MDDLTVAVLAVVVLVVLYLVFYKPSAIVVVPTVNVDAAIIKATASCAAVKDEATYNTFLVDYNAAVAAINNGPDTDAVLNFKNLTCSKYSSYLTMVDLFEAAFDKALVASPSDAELKNAGVLMANIIYMMPQYRSTSDFPEFLAKKLDAASDKMDLIKQKGMPPAGMVVPFADELFRIVTNEELFTKKQKDAGIYENYRNNLKSAQRAIQQWETLGPTGPSGEKIKNMQPLANP